MGFRRKLRCDVDNIEESSRCEARVDIVGQHATAVNGVEWRRRANGRSGVRERAGGW